MPKGAEAKEGIEVEPVRSGTESMTWLPFGVFHVDDDVEAVAEQQLLYGREYVFRRYKMFRCH